MNSENLLNTQEAAQYLGLHPQTLNQWRHEKMGPVYYKLQYGIRYKREDLDSYLTRIDPRVA